MKSPKDNGIKPSVELDKILDRLVSSVVGLKLSNAKDYKEFVPTAEQAIQSLIDSRVQEGEQQFLKDLIQRQNKYTNGVLWGDSEFGKGKHAEAKNTLQWLRDNVANVEELEESK